MMSGEKTLTDILLQVLEDLEKKELKKFKHKLSDFHYEGECKISRGELENADEIDVANLLIRYCGEDSALTVAIEIFDKIGLKKYVLKLQEEKEKVLVPSTRSLSASTLSLKTTQDYKKKYREHIQEQYQAIEDRNALLSDFVSLNNRYTELIIVKQHRRREKKEHEIKNRGGRHAELMAQQTSLTKIGVLFEPEGDLQSPKTVVLQGVVGIGKTMTARKIMLDWAAGKLYQKYFDYVFYIDCRTINCVTGEQSVADLVLNNCPDGKGPIKEIFAKPEKLLFIIDGFDELSSLLDMEAVSVCTDPSEKKPVGIVLRSLLRKKVLQKSFLLITTRPTAVKELKENLKFPRYAEIMGFSGDERKEYFHKFFCDEKKAKQAFDLVKENEMLFTMCFVPIVCCIICKIINQQMERGDDLAQTSKTTTSLYLLFLTSLTDLKHEQTSRANLGKLCSLAADGILEQKILFEEGDLQKHNLSFSNIQSLFLNESVFQKDTGRESVYSFIHLSFQEFFAALFYVLEEDGKTVKKSVFSKKDVNNLLKIYGKSKNNYLMLTVLFLFGLLNKESLNDIQKRLHCKTSSKIKLDLLKWFQAEFKKPSCLSYKTDEEPCDQLEFFHYLYELQEEEFARGAMNNFQEIRLEHIRFTAMDEIALSFCVKNCCSKQSLYLCKCILGLPEREEGRIEKLRKRLSPLNRGLKELRNSSAHILCQGLNDANCKLKTISLSSCKFSFAFLEDLSPSTLFTNQSLEKLDLSANELGDIGLKHLCDGLKHPKCSLQKLLLWQCGLTAVCCGHLSDALSKNQSLIELELSGNKLGDSGLKLLCEGLKHPRCKLQKFVGWDCQLTDACCEDLSSLLSTNQSLRELNLSGNNLSYPGVKVLCEILRLPNCKLEKIDLSENHIDEETTKELENLQKIKPGLLIVPNVGFIQQNPSRKTSWMACLLSQCCTFICRLKSLSVNMAWNIFVVHCWEVVFVLLLSIAIYYLL